MTEQISVYLKDGLDKRMSDKTCPIPVHSSCGVQSQTTDHHCDLRDAETTRTESVEGDTLIAKAGRGRGRKHRGEGRMGGGRGGRGRGGCGGGGGRGGDEEEGATTTTTSPTELTATGKIKRPQYCTICKNHNLQVLKKRHKCPYKDCQCALCNLSRRVQCVMCHQQRLWRFRKSQEKNGPTSATSPSSGGGTEPPTSPNSSPSASPASGFVSEGDSRLQEAAVDDPLGASDLADSRERLKAERSGKQQVCDKCRNHDVWVLKRGHKGKCPFESCSCKYCNFTIKRRDLMKHQQRVRRAQVTAIPAENPQDFVLAAAENSPAEKTDISATAENSPVSSPVRLTNTPSNDQEAQINNNKNNNDNTHVQSNENPVSWPSCSKDENEDSGIPEDHFPPSRGTGLCQQLSGESPSHQQPINNECQQLTMDSNPIQSPSNDSSPFQKQVRNSTTFQKPGRESTILPESNRNHKSFQYSSEVFQHTRMTSPSLQYSSKNSTANQSPSTDSTPFQEPTRDSSPFQHLNGEFTAYQLSNRDSTPFDQQSRDSKTFQHPCNNSPSPPYQHPVTNSTPFHYPSSNSPQFHTPVRESTPFHHSNNCESPQFQQPVRGPTPFHHSNSESPPFHQPMRESTPFPHGSSESPQFQQPLRGPTPFHHSNSEPPPFHQPVRESTPFQHDHSDPPQFQQPARGPTPFQHGSSESPPFQQPIRGPTPFQHCNNNLQSFQQPMSNCTPLQHYNRDSSPYQPSRNTSTFQPNSGSMPFQQQYNESTIFQQHVPVTHVTDYASKLAEDPMDLPLKRMKVEPNFDDEMTYDSNGNLGPSVNFMAASPDYTSLRNYDSSNSEMHHFARMQPQPKFGVQPEDLMLRQWPTNSIEQEEEMVDSKSLLHNGIDYRKTSVCSISAHIQQQQQLAIPQQHQIQQPQSSHVPIATRADSRSYESSAISLTGSLGLPVSTTMIPSASLSRGLSSTGNFVQASLSAMNLTACKAFVPQSAMQSQSTWWHQARLPNLERTNSG